MKTAEPSLTEKAAPLLSLDLTDTANVALAGYAGRIATPADGRHRFSQHRPCGITVGRRGRGVSR